MASWLKTADSNGSCCDCQPAVCDQCYTCPLELEYTNSGGGPDSSYIAFNVTISDLTIEQDTVIDIWFDFWGVLANELVIYADEVAMYDSTCVIGSDSAHVTIPAGTTSVRYYLQGSCNAPQGTTDLWSVIIQCFSP